MKSKKGHQAVIANKCQLLACAGLITQARLRLLLLVLLPIFLVGNAIGATGEEEPVIVYSELCPSCSMENPFYNLKLFRSGRAVYDGPLLIDTAIPFTTNVLEKGQRETQIPPEEVGRWIEMLLAADFFALEKSYIDKQCPLDRMDQAIALSINEDTNAIRWVRCINKDIPRVLDEVGKQIKIKVNPWQWMKTLPYEDSPVYRRKAQQFK